MSSQPPKLSEAFSRTLVSNPQFGNLEAPPILSMRMRTGAMPMQKESITFPKEESLTQIASSSLQKESVSALKERTPTLKESASYKKESALMQKEPIPGLFAPASLQKLTATTLLETNWQRMILKERKHTIYWSSINITRNQLQSKQTVSIIK